MDTRTTSQMSIHEAAEEGNYEVVKGFLRENPNLVNSRNEHGNTPLHLAAQEGHTAIVKLLLANKVDPNLVNSRNDHGNTPLHLAAQAGHTKIVRLLLEKKADLFSENKMQKTPLFLIVEKPTPRNPDPVTDQHHEVVKLLLQAGISAHQLTTLGADDALLHVAASNGHTEIVRLFLMHGADLNALGRTYSPAWRYSLYQVDTFCIFLKHPNIDFKLGYEDSETVLTGIVDSIKSFKQDAIILAPELLGRYEKCLKYWILSGADIDGQAIEEDCNRYASGEPSLDFYIKELICKAVAIKRQAKGVFNELGLPSLLLKHFLLSSGDTRKEFLETAKALFYLPFEYLVIARQDPDKCPLSRLPREIFDQIIGEVLEGGYRFPTVVSNASKETSPRP